jgi:hypothetical protein
MFFKFQVEEILEEVSLKNKRKKEIEKWIELLHEAINRIPNDKKKPVS